MLQEASSRAQNMRRRPGAAGSMPKCAACRTCKQYVGLVDKCQVHAVLLEPRAPTAEHRDSLRQLAEHTMMVG